MKEQKLPQGYLDFTKRLEENTKDKGTEKANIDCENCGQNVLLVGPGLVSMHVFMYPDDPHYTTKALCFNCMNAEFKKHGGAQISKVLN